MKKVVAFMAIVLMIVLFANGCVLFDTFDEIDSAIEESKKPKVSCTTDKQYLGEYGLNYYIEGECVNKGIKDYNYLQVEYICYDEDGNNLGTALDNTTNLLSGQTWKFKALSLVSDSKEIDYCNYYKVTGW